MIPSLWVWSAFPGGCVHSSFWKHLRGPGGAFRDPGVFAFEQLADSWLCDWRSEPLRPPATFQSQQCKIKTQYHFSTLLGSWLLPLIKGSFLLNFRSKRSFFVLKASCLTLGSQKAVGSFFSFPPNPWPEFPVLGLLMHQQNMYSGIRKSILVLWPFRTGQEEISSSQPILWLRAGLLPESFSVLRDLRFNNLVAKSCPTLSNPMDCSLRGSSVHGILQARIMKWVAVSFSRGSSRLRDRTRVSCIIGRFFTV